MDRSTRLTSNLGGGGEIAKTKLDLRIAAGQLPSIRLNITNACARYLEAIEPALPNGNGMQSGQRAQREGEAVI